MYTNVAMPTARRKSTDAAVNRPTLKAPSTQFSLPLLDGSNTSTIVVSPTSPRACTALRSSLRVGCVSRASVRTPPTRLRSSPRAAPRQLQLGDRDPTYYLHTYIPRLLLDRHLSQPSGRPSDCLARAHSSPPPASIAVCKHGRHRRRPVGASAARLRLRR